MADGTDAPKQIENDTPPTTPPPEPTSPAPKTFDESYVKDLRAEAKKHREEAKAAKTRLQELEAAQVAADTAELEAQGQWKELAEQNAAKTAELETQLAEQNVALQTERRNTLAVSIATQLDAINPTDANFQLAVAAIDIAADDAETKIRQALEALRDGNFSYLFGTAKPNLAPFNPSGQPQDPPKETPAHQRERIRGGGGKSFFDVTVYKPEGGEEIVKGG